MDSGMNGRGAATQTITDLHAPHKLVAQIAKMGTRAAGLNDERAPTRKCKCRRGVKGDTGL